MGSGDPQAAPTSWPTEIGSDFELVGGEYLTRPAGVLPWDGPLTTYVANGRQALSLTAESLWRRGLRTIHVPGYLCDSMIEPFTKDWKVVALPTTADLETPPDAVGSLKASVLLNAPYFGRSPSSDMVTALRTARRAGVVVVTDETHRVLDEPCIETDIRVASLRKLLPVFDGGYAIGLPTEDTHVGPSNSDAVAQRHRAMSTKTANLSKPGPQSSHLAMFHESERALTVDLTPRAMSAPTLDLLRRLNLPELAVRRRQNAEALVKALSRQSALRVLNPPSATTNPSHIVLEVSDPQALREWLARRRIYCPIHWPPSELLPHRSDWPQRFLSVPIDHRYGVEDMHHIGAAVHEGLESLKAPRKTRSR